MVNKTSWKFRLKIAMFSLPGVINCREFEELIIKHLEQDLTDTEVRRFETHLKVCAECREYLAAYLTSAEVAPQTLADKILPDEVPEELIKAVLASLKGE